MAGLHAHRLIEPRKSSLEATIDGSKRLFVCLFFQWPGPSGLVSMLVFWLLNVS